MATGSGVPLKASPTGTAINTEMTVETDPAIDAAMPAMCPIGSIARALRFPSEKPSMKKIEVDQRK